MVATRVGDRGNYAGVWMNQAADRELRLNQMEGDFLDSLKHRMREILIGCLERAGTKNLVISRVANNPHSV